MVAGDLRLIIRGILADFRLCDTTDSQRGFARGFQLNIIWIFSMRFSLHSVYDFMYKFCLFCLFFYAFSYFMYILFRSLVLTVRILNVSLVFRFYLHCLLYHLHVFFVSILTSILTFCLCTFNYFYSILFHFYFISHCAMLQCWILSIRMVYFHAQNWMD